MSRLPVIQNLLTVREFVQLAFIAWQGTGIDEQGIDSNTGRILVEVDISLFRPSEVELLLGDPRKAQRELGWKRKISFQELVRQMVAHDLNSAIENG